MKKEMLINVLQPEECRIAIVEDGVLEELYVERTSHESYVGNIYKGRIVNIEPSIQAAFVDFGIGRNGFLHVSDVEPAYYRHLEPARNDRGGRRGPNGGGRGGRYRMRTPVEAPPEEEAFDEAPPAAREPVEKRETPGSEEKARGRGRHRGRGRRGRREERALPPAEMMPEARPASESEQGAEMRSHFETAEPDAGPPEVEEKPRWDDDRPLFMDSADRHTEEGDDPREPLEPAPSVSDEDIFFPRSPEPAPAPSFTAEKPAPSVWEEERRYPEASAPAPVHEREEEEEEAEEPLEAAEIESSEEEMAEDRAARFPEFEEEEEPAPRRHRDRGDRGDRDRGRGRRVGFRGAPGMRPKPLIQDIFRRGQEVLVQVIKEGIGTKGPTLSTYISIAGRYLVLMPGLNRIGVSRKIVDEEQRRRLREVLSELEPPKGLGFIIRTAGIDRNKKELQRDLAYLTRLWQVVARRIRKIKSPAEIYRESDMITRTIRDVFTSEINAIWVDEPTAFEHAQEFLQIVMPRYANRIKLYDDPAPMFHKYGIEKEITRIHQRHVPLPYGGSIVIDQTEALVAIDVNSGTFRADNNAEETAYQMNLHAAKEIARHLRLRDLGGVIVNDFIDMREEKHRRGVEKALRDAVKRDRARTKILKISAFGIIEMTRQRIRPSLKRSVYQDCAHCRGTGQVKTCESISIDAMRLLQLAAHRESVRRVQIRVTEEVAGYLLNKKRKEISRLEEVGDIQVHITGLTGVSPETLDFVCTDNNNNEVRLFPAEETRPYRR